MTCKLFLNILVLLLLVIGCSSEGTDEFSPTLRISWDRQPDYNYYFYTVVGKSRPLGRGDTCREEEEWIYSWKDENIGVYAVACPIRTVERGFYPEADGEGQLFLKMNGRAQSLTYHDLMVAQLPDIFCGKAEARLEFQYSMSLVSVVIRLSERLKERNLRFHIRIVGLLQQGHIDFTKGIIQTDGVKKEAVYLEKAETKIYTYQALVVPQLMEAAKISVFPEQWEVVKGIDWLVKNQKLEGGREYRWIFEEEGNGILSFKELQIQERQ